MLKKTVELNFKSVCSLKKHYVWIHLQTIMIVNWSCHHLGDVSIGSSLSPHTQLFAFSFLVRRPHNYPLTLKLPILPQHSSKSGTAQLPPCYLLLLLRVCNFFQNTNQNFQMLAISNMFQDAQLQCQSKRNSAFKQKPTKWKQLETVLLWVVVDNQNNDSCYG